MLSLMKKKKSLKKLFALIIEKISPEKEKKVLQKGNSSL